MASLSLWVGFSVGVALLLAADLALMGRRAGGASFKEAAAWSGFWIAISIGFNLWLWCRYGGNLALRFLTAYLIEKSLSVDNLFVFVVLFRYFAVEAQCQHRVLYWGVLGALALRGGMIAAGVSLIRHFQWVFYLFGVFLVYAGLKMLFEKAALARPEKNPLFLWTRRHLPVTRDFQGGRFFAREGGRWVATPLFLALLSVEAADLLFALDSIPAVFGVTRDPFIVFSSNACAVLGLRALYFVMADLLPRLRHLSAGISLVLVFIGAKMLVADWLHIPVVFSLGIVVAVLAVTIAASLLALPTNCASGKHAGNAKTNRSNRA